jgi:hypothetical protein
MYYMSESEFMQYETAEKQFNDIRKQHAVELKQAYDGIHPTRARFDYEQRRIYCESVNPADYAIYLVELREEHERIEKWWSLRATAYRESLEMLTNEERNSFHLCGYSNYEKHEKARKGLREVLTKIVATRPDLQRQSIQFDELEDLDEVDRQIDKLSMEELLENYWDLDEPEEEHSKKNASVEPIINPNKNALVNTVKNSYLPPDELEKYRSGKKGGSRWFSYDDYLQMNESGMSNKEIAKKMEISMDQLYKRLKVWKGEPLVKGYFKKELKA